jgi:hypothetical protein
MTKKLNVLRTLVVLSSLLILSSCYYDEAIEEIIPEDTIVSFSAEIQPIFNTNCTSCHPLIVAAPNLTEDNSYDAIHMGSYIVSKDLDASILYQRLLGQPSVMPPSGPLPKNEIDLVKRWIEQGALNN